MKTNISQKAYPFFMRVLTVFGILCTLLTGGEIKANPPGEKSHVILPGNPNLATADLENGIYWIKVVGSGKYLREKGDGDKFVSTRHQIDDDFSKFSVKKNTDGSYIIRVLANNRHLHVDISTDSKLSTRFQPGENDECSRFELERMTDGNYQIRVQCANDFVLKEDDKGFISALSDATDNMARFAFTPKVDFPVGESQTSDGLIGHLDTGIDRSPTAGDGLGIGFYVSIFPMITAPMKNFQIGLPSTWLNPENDGVDKLLCPPESYAGENWTHLIPDKFRQHFQTLEGGTGYWTSTHFSTKMPKYRINGTPNCYDSQISSPGWSFTEKTPLTSNEMGIAQLSNRMLLPPDGLTFAPNTNGELLGTAWMALPLINRKGFFHLQTASMLSDQCLEGKGRKVAATRTTINKDNNATQLYQIQDLFNGYVRFTHPDQNTALEGNQLVGSVAGGAAFMDGGSFSGQIWKLKPVGNDYYQLTTQFLESKNKCLELDEKTGKAFMKDCQETPTPQQKWKLTGAEHDGVTPTGDKSWTLFINSINFKGPLAFWIPATWSKISIGRDSVSGRGLDQRLAVVNQASIEVGRLPYFMKKTSTGEVYTKIPRLQFPVNTTSESPFMVGLSYFSAEALYSKVMKWFDGGERASGSFNGGIGTLANLRVNPINLRQSSQGFPIDVSDVVSVEKQEGFNSSFGFKWKSATTAGVFPQYYKKSFDKMVAVPETSVPENLGLITKTFTPTTDGAPFDVIKDEVAVNPLYSAYGFPIPTSDLDTVNLNDGTRVIYKWYKFVDQPSLQQYNMTIKEKNQLQQRVEKIHKEWGINQPYMPDPIKSNGPTPDLVTFDQGLIVTPPHGKEFGYVPIALKQEKR